MLGYKLTTEQKELIQGVFFTDNQFFNCVQDINGDWFLFLSEHEKNILNEFSWILDCVEYEYLAPVKNDIIN